MILASKSPRRKELLKKAGFSFLVNSADVAEDYPNDLALQDVPLYLAEQKATPIAMQFPNHIVIGVDTVVILEEQIIGKPENPLQAIHFLQKLNGKMHQVISGVSVHWNSEKLQFQEITNVFFQHLPNELLEFYVANYRPLDKAGAYGIQEFIGILGVERIEGDFYNVMGLPVARLFKELQNKGWLIL